MEIFLKAGDVNHLRMSMYDPQTNSHVECMNRVMIRCVQWAMANRCVVLNALHSMLLFYSTSPHSITQVSPF